jgi:hypothetical protein
MDTSHFSSNAIIFDHYPAHERTISFKWQLFQTRPRVHFHLTVTGCQDPGHPVPRGEHLHPPAFSLHIDRDSHGLVPGLP